MGWFGSICLSLCALPQVIQCIITGNANGINWLFLLMWLSGEISLFIYLLPKNETALLFNYGLNIIFLLIIIRYKIAPIKKTIYTHDDSWYNDNK